MEGANTAEISEGNLLSQIKRLRADLVTKKCNEDEADEKFRALTLEAVKLSSKVPIESSNLLFNTLLLARTDLDQEELDVACKLKELKSNSFKKRCGKIFSPGDLVYYCQTCAVDSTCVLCQECFTDSNHEGHEVIFHKSGGGCCDCGDEEAWSVDGFCSRHGNKRGADPLSTLNWELVHQGEIIFRIMNKILAETVSEILISYERTQWRSPLDDDNALEDRNKDTGESFFEISNGEGQWHLLINNDDIHTYNEVIDVLMEMPLGMSGLQAEEATRMIDKKGRASVWKSATFSSATTAKKELAIARNISTNLQEHGLLTCISYALQQKQEIEAINCLKWLIELVELSDGLVRLITNALLEPLDLPNLRMARYGGERYMTNRIPSWANEHPSFLTPEREKCLLLDVLRFNFLLPKVLVATLHDLCLRALVDEEFKIVFGCLYAQTYPNVASAYSHGLGTQKESCLDFGVQLLTTPSVLKALSEKDDFIELSLRTLLSFLIDTLEKEKQDDYLLHGINLEAKSILHRRHQPFVHNLDMMFNMNILPLLHLHEHEKEIALHKVTILTKILSGIQNMDPQCRHQGKDHVEFENKTYVQAFDVSLGFSRFIRRGAIQLASEINDAKLLVDIVEKFDETYIRTLASTYKYISKETKFFGCNEFLDASLYLGAPVSFHLPIQRFLGLLIRTFALNSSLDGVRIKEDLLDDSIICRIIQEPLKLLAANAQIVSGLWRRNGTVMQHQSMLYQDQLVQHMYLLDIFMVQIAASVLPHKRFVGMMLHHFGLLEYIERKPLDRCIDHESLPILFEELLRVFAIISEEIPGEQQDHRSLRKQVIHRLAVGKSNGFSDIVESVKAESTAEVKDEATVKAIVDSVAKMDTGIYVLNDEIWDEVDPFYWLLNRLEQEEVFANKASRYKEKGKTSWPVAKPIKFRPLKLYQGCFGLFLSQPFLAVLHSLLIDIVGSSNTIRGSNGTGIAMLLDFEEGNLTWVSFDSSKYSSRTTISLMSTALYVLTLCLRKCEENGLISLEELMRWPERRNSELCLEKANFLELLIAWFQDVESNSEDYLPNLKWCISFIRSKSKDIKDRCNLIYDFMGVGNKKKGKQKRDQKQRAKAAAAQKAAMERMRKQMDAFKELEAPSTEKVERKQSLPTSNLCALCRESSSIDNPMSYVGFVQSSSWGLVLPLEVDEVPPAVLNSRRKYAGWTPRTSQPASLSSLLQAAFERQNNQNGLVNVPNTVNFDNLRDILANFEMQEENNLPPSRQTMVLRQGGTAPSTGENEEIDWGLTNQYNRTRDSDSDSDFEHGSEEVGFQESNPKTPHVRPPSKLGNHLSFCGHKLHRSCLEKYVDTRGRRGQSQISYDPRNGEFLCPICKSISNVFFPYIEEDESRADSKRLKLSKESRNISDVDEIVEFLWRQASKNEGSIAGEGQITTVWEALQYHLPEEIAIMKQENHMSEALSSSLQNILQRLVRNCYLPIAFSEGSKSQAISYIIALLKSVAFSLSSFEKVHHEYCTDGSDSVFLIPNSSSIVAKIEQERESWKSLLFCLRLLGVNMLNQPIDSKIRKIKDQDSSSRKSYSKKTGLHKNTSERAIRRRRSKSFLQSRIPLILRQTGIRIRQGMEEETKPEDDDTKMKHHLLGSNNDFCEYDVAFRIPLLSILVTGSDSGLDDTFRINAKPFLAESVCTPVLHGDYPNKSTVNASNSCSIPEYVERMQSFDALIDPDLLKLEVAKNHQDNSVYVETLENGGDEESNDDIQLGDYILKINGKSIQDMPFEQVVAEIKGSEGQRNENGQLELRFCRYADAGALLDCNDMFPLLVAFHSCLKPSKLQSKELVLVIRILSIATLVAASISRMRATSKLSTRGCQRKSTIPSGWREAFAKFWSFVNERTFDKEVTITSNDQDYIFLDIYIPFLRNAALLLDLLCDYAYVNRFERLREDVADELQYYTERFGIPRLQDILGNETMIALLLSWITEWKIHNPNARPRISQEMTKNGPGDCCYLRSATRIIALPEMYQDLYLQIKKQAKCATTGEAILRPLLCLRCGSVMCGSGTCCKRGAKGPATIHTEACCGSSGAFLNLSSCEVLLIRKQYSVMMNAPYIDKYGEHDPELRKGRMLRFEEKEYSRIQEMCTTHGTAHHVTDVRNNEDRQIRLNYF